MKTAIFALLFGATFALGDVVIPEGTSPAPINETIRKGSSSSGRGGKGSRPEDSVEGEPVCVTGDPFCVEGNPVCVAGDPVCAAGAPICVAGEPVCVADRGSSGAAVRSQPAMVVWLAVVVGAVWCSWDKSCAMAGWL